MVPGALAGGGEPLARGGRSARGRVGEGAARSHARVVPGVLLPVGSRPVRLLLGAEDAAGAAGHVLGESV